MPNYSKRGKILVPLSETEFVKGMTSDKFKEPKHKGLAALLYYTGVRITEALRSTREQYSLQDDRIFFEVLKRLKHGRQTPPLVIPLKRAFAGEIWKAVEDTEKGKRVFPYSRRTGYNVVARLWHYPHHLRFTRITNLANYRDEYGDRLSIASIMNYTGLTLGALNFYIGLVEIREMGEA